MNENFLIKQLLINQVSIMMAFLEDVSEEQKKLALETAIETSKLIIKLYDQ